MKDKSKAKKKQLPKDAEYSELKELKDEMKKKDDVITDHKNKLLRSLADLENYKKVMAKEREEMIKFSNETLIVSLLPIIDSFDRALAQAEKNGDKEDIVKGLALIKRQFEDALVKFGVKQIEALGKPFDPAFHEAVIQKEDKEKQDGVVLEEMQKGYTLHGKTIRAAMVIVNKRK